ncbi:MAG: TonB-dependent receptor [Pacificimonas sp.]
MNRFKLRGALVAGTALTALGITLPVNAQDSVQETVADSQALDADEDVIIVTARRRDERLIDVPIAITSISGAELESRGVLELTEIAQTVPNVTLEVSRGTNTTLTAFIRGVGQQDPVAGFEQGVGVYIDDVYLNRPQAAVLDIYDVERIEVLRGPQGTLYGRNTIGGAIKYVTGRLPNEFETKVRATYGSYDQAEAVVSVSAPIVDGLKIGASAARLSRGGFGDNLVQDGVENYNKDVWGARLTVEAEPTEALFVRLSGDYIKDESDPRQGTRLIPGIVSGAPVLDDVFDTRAGLDVIEQEVEAYGGALSAELDLGLVKLRSITAYREDKSTTPIDFDSLPAADLDVPAIYENDQFSQELQLLYEGDRLSGLVGAYYLNANALTSFDVLLDVFGTAIGFPGFNAQTFGEVDTETWSVFGDFSYDLTDRFSVSLGGRYTSDERQSRVLRTSFVGGFSDTFGGSGVPFAVTSDFDGGETFTEFTPRASISFQPTLDHNIFASYSQGFKGGGFDPRGQTTAAPDLDGDGDIDADDQFEFLRFAPETVDSYEVGWKASLLDNRVNFSLVGFYADYTDVQIPGSVGADTDGDGVNDNFIGITSNAGEATIKGVEFEGTARVADGLDGGSGRIDFGWSLGIIDAEFDQFIDAFGNDVADQRVFQNTPDITASARLDIAGPLRLFTEGELGVGGQVSYRDDASQFETPNRFLDQDGYALVDANITWTADDDSLRLGIYGKNLFDKRYIVAGYNFVDTPIGGPITPTLGVDGTLTGFYGDPRRVFATAEFRF